MAKVVADSMTLMTTESNWKVEMLKKKKREKKDVLYDVFQLGCQNNPSRFEAAGRESGLDVWGAESSIPPACVYLQCCTRGGAKLPDFLAASIAAGHMKR
jgi:hypothetical protein